MMRPALLFFLLIFSANLIGQEYNARHFTTQDGLPSGKITNLFEDSRGFLWISTDAGLCRYDGRRFVNYSVEDGLNFSLINQVDEDSKGVIWIATGRGVCRFDGNSFQSFYKYAQTDMGEIRDLVCAGGNTVLACSKQGLFSIRGDSIKKLTKADGLISNNCLSLHRTSTGRIFIGCEGGISEWKDGKITTFRQTEKTDRVINMASDRQGFLWFGLLDNEIRRIPLKADSQSRSVYIPGMENKMVSGFFCAFDSLVYVGRENSLCVLKGEQLVKEVPIPFKIPSDILNAVLHDQAGNIWVGSLYGLWRLSPAFVYFYEDAAVKERSIVDVLAISPDSVFFTDGRSVYLKTPAATKEVFTDMPGFSGEISEFGRDRYGYWYFGSLMEGLIILDPQGRYHRADPQISRILSIENDPEGNILVGSSNAVYTGRAGKLSKFETGPHRDVNFLSIGSKTKGETWLGTNRGMLLVKGKKVYDFQAIFNGSEVVVTSFSFYKNEVYAATKGKGIYQLEPAGDSFRVKKQFVSAQGLASDFVSSCLVDKMGQLWASTLSGPGKRVSGPEGEYFIKYNVDNGVPQAFWNFSQFSGDSLGRLWIGSSEGLVMIDPAREKRRNKLPDLQLLSVKNLSTSRLQPNQALGVFFGSTVPVISYGENLLLYYTTISLDGWNHVQYNYKLDGANNSWEFAPLSGILSLNHLMPGKYRLRIRAMGPGRQINSNELIYDFEVSRPFWMSGWFYFLIVIAGLAVVYLVFRWRVAINYAKQHEKLSYRKQLLESRYMAFQARMNPHFIFNSLNAIQYFITNNDKKSSLRYVAKFGRLLRQVLDNSRASKITLYEEIEILHSYLEMESMRFENQFTYSFNISKDINLHSIEIPGMILQPFVENAIVHGLLHKHDGTGLLLVTFIQEENFVRCTIEDNGIGRKRSAEINTMRSPNHKSHGMEIAVERLSLFASETNTENLIEIEDLENPTGTRINIKLPIV